MTTNKQRWSKQKGWAVPLAYVAVTVVVGMVFPRLEHRFLPNLVGSMSVASAMAISSSVASGMIAMTGIVFSLAFVMVQFSATAYSPRLVLWVARDPVVAHALGVFSATFLYALILLAWLDRSASGRVPLLSGWAVVLLLIASIGMFVALIERVGMLQVNRMLIYTANHGRKAIDELYPAPAPVVTAAPAPAHPTLPLTQTITYVGQPQVIQSVQVRELVSLAKASGGVIEMVAAVGDTLLELTPLARVYGTRQPVEEEALKHAIEIGDERTFDQDPKYALRLLVDIAIKALSPAINDPTTAVQALDQIQALLLQLGRRQLEVGEYRDDQGAVRLVLPCPTWEDFLRLSLDEVRYYGASSVQVMRRMNALIKNLLEVLPASRHPALRHWKERLHETVERSYADAEEKQDASVADRQGLGIGEDTMEDAK